MLAQNFVEIYRASVFVLVLRLNLQRNVRIALLEIRIYRRFEIISERCHVSVQKNGKNLKHGSIILQKETRLKISKIICVRFKRLWDNWDEMPNQKPIQTNDKFGPKF